MNLQCQSYLGIPWSPWGYLVFFLRRQGKFSKVWFPSSKFYSTCLKIKLQLEKNELWKRQSYQLIEPFPRSTLYQQFNCTLSGTHRSFPSSRRTYRTLWSSPTQRGLSEIPGNLSPRREPGEHTPAVGDTFCNCHTTVAPLIVATGAVRFLSNQ